MSFQPLASCKDTFVFPNEVLGYSVLPKTWPCSPSTFQLSAVSRHDSSRIGATEALYAISDYFDVPDLRKLCKVAFLACIGIGNVLEELADRFGRMHKPITEGLESFAVENWVRQIHNSTPTSIDNANETFR